MTSGALTAMVPYAVSVPVPCDVLLDPLTPTVLLKLVESAGVSTLPMECYSHSLLPQYTSVVFWYILTECTNFYMQEKKFYE